VISFTMKPTTRPWLLALVTMVAILPQKSYCDVLQQLPMISPYARYRCATFIHHSHSHDSIKPLSLSLMNKKLCTNRFDPPSKVTARQPGATQLAMLQRTSPSPWSPGSWEIMLDFGREESSERNDNSQLSNILGEEWGSNGGRLALSFEIVASAETTNEKSGGESSVQMTWLGGKPTGTVECVSRTRNNDENYCASYINERGQQNVQISSGQWRIEPPLPLLPTYSNILPGQASTLRFYIELATSIKRNSITFPKDQLLLLQSNTFRTQQYSSGVQTLLPYQYYKDISQKQVEEQLNHETGDRRLDGNDILETLGGYKDVAEMVLERDKQRRKWREVEGVLPKLDSTIDTSRKVDINKLLEDEDRWGIWPGDTELMTIERGVILAVVAKEPKQKMGLFPWMQDGSKVEEPVVVGKWSILPIFDE